MNQISQTSDQPRAMPKKELATREPADLMQTMIKAMADPKFDIEKLKQLRAIYNEEVADQRRLAYDAAMAECQKHIPIIKANKRNTHTDSVYATLDAISKEVTPVYTEHGFSVSFGMDESKLEKHYGITARVSHEAGHVSTFRADVPVDDVGAKGTTNKTGVQAFGSTLSYAQRYMLKLIFNIAIEGEDKDGNKIKDESLITPNQVAILRKIIKDSGLDEAEFCALGPIEKLEDMPARKYDAAKIHLEQAAKARSNAKRR